MKLRDTLCIGMSLAPTWLSNEGWRRPDSGIEGLFGAPFAIDIARRAEQAHLDFVFRPDASSLPLPPLETSFGFASLDPTLVMAAVAGATRKIGLVTTIPTTFSHPFTVARQMMSLHWMSGGRAGWNVVTALQGHENFGLSQMPSSEQRYARAAEFVAAAEALWRSFPAQALTIDKASGQYADTRQIGPADHHGAVFDIAGPLTIPAFPGPRIPVMQAGASPAGVALAGQIADMVFAQTLDTASGLSARAALTAAARAAGRAPRDVRLLPGLSLYLAPSRAQAREAFMENHIRVDRPARIARLTAALGLDVTDWPAARRLSPADLPPLPEGGTGSVQGRILRGIIDRDRPSVAEVLQRPELLASVHWQVIGTVEDARRAITARFEAGAMDGFIAVPGGTTEALRLTLEALVPQLAADGLFRTAYRADTLAGHLAEG